MQRWNEIRAHILREFIEDLRTYFEQKIADQEQGQQQENKLSILDSNNNSEIEWIEQLILIPITEYRKRDIDLIFVPYFIFVKKYSNEETTKNIPEWLKKCNSVRNRFRY